MTLYGRAMTNLLWERTSALDDESPGAAVTDDVAGRRVMEVRAEHGDIRAGVPLAERAPGLARLLRVGIEMATPVGLGHLHGAVHEVAGDDGLGVVRLQAHAHVPGRVTGRRLETHLIRHAVVHGDEVGKARVQHRR